MRVIEIDSRAVLAVGTDENEGIVPLASECPKAYSRTESHGFIRIRHREDMDFLNPEQTCRSLTGSSICSGFVRVLRRVDPVEYRSEDGDPMKMYTVLVRCSADDSALMEARSAREGSRSNVLQEGDECE